MFRRLATFVWSSMVETSCKAVLEVNFNHRPWDHTNPFAGLRNVYHHVIAAFTKELFTLYIIQIVIAVSLLDMNI